jgi:hypothetical protein
MRAIKFLAGTDRFAEYGAAGFISHFQKALP